MTEDQAESSPLMDADLELAHLKMQSVVKSVETMARWSRGSLVLVIGATICVVGAMVFVLRSGDTVSSQQNYSRNTDLTVERERRAQRALYEHELASSENERLRQTIARMQRDETAIRAELDMLAKAEQLTKDELQIEQERNAALIKENASLASKRRDEAMDAYLRQILSDVSGQARLIAAQALSKSRDPRAVTALAIALTKDVDPTVRREAALALGKLLDKRSADDLRKLGLQTLALAADNDPDLDVCAAADSALHAIVRRLQSRGS